MELQLIMLDNPIIVSDKEIKVGDIAIDLTEDFGLKYQTFIVDQVTLEYSNKECKKVVAQSHQIDWNCLEDEFGYVDLNKLSMEWYDHAKFKSSLRADPESFSQGFKKHQELTDKKFQEAKELIEYFVNRCEEGSIRSRTTYAKYKSFLDSLEQPKSFKIEVEMISFYDDLNKEEIEQIEKELGIYDHDQGLNERELKAYAKENPKFVSDIIDGKIKIIKKL